MTQFSATSSTPLRCPYPSPRVMPWLDDYVVQPDEIVEVPDELVENFRAAGWRAPDQPVVWPPESAAPPAPASDQVADENPPADATPSTPVVVELPPDTSGQGTDDTAPAEKPAPSSSATPSKKAR